MRVSASMSDHQIIVTANREELSAIADLCDDLAAFENDGDDDREHAFGPLLLRLAE